VVAFQRVAKVPRVETRAMPDPLIDTRVSVSDRMRGELNPRLRLPTDQQATGWSIVYGSWSPTRVAALYARNPSNKKRPVRGCSSVVRAGDS
jgi:hypothetical protein